MTPTPFNNLSPAETERLSILAEECAEVILVVGKTLRHGWTPTDHSVNPPKGYDNREDLITELGHVRNAIDLLIEKGDLGNFALHGIAISAAAKRAKWGPYLHHQS